MGSAHRGEIESNIGLRCRREIPTHWSKIMPETGFGKPVMPETRFTKFLALYFDPSCWDFSVCIADGYVIIFLTYDIQNYYLSFVFDT